MNIKVELSRAENIEKYGAKTVEIDFEEYVKGVVPSEIGNALLEACKAQAVAARTFALARFKGKGYITDKSSVDQAFRASRISSSYPNAMLAVEETAGEVLYYNNGLVGTCVYSASNGGRIRSSEEVWGGKRGYLVAKDDPYDTKTKNGHGVGMSQAGAKEMARQGYSYKQILEFYYPTTQLRKSYGEEEVVRVPDTTKADIVVEWLKSRVDLQCGYIWGTTGQTCTQALITAKHTQYPDHVNPNIVKKWLGKPVYDCQGLVRRALERVDIKMVAGSNSQWTKTKWLAKGTIDTLPSDRVCCLFRYDKDKKRMGHVGIYLGDGEHFIHAAGSSTGVVMDTIKNYGRWTHWGIPEGLYAIEDVSNTQSISGLKRGMYGPAVKKLQELLLAAGESLPKYGADSDFGKETEKALKLYQEKHQLPQTGVVDAETEKALLGVDPIIDDLIDDDTDDEPPTDDNVPAPISYNATVQAQNGTAVNMRFEPNKNSDVVAKVPNGEIVEVINTENEWSAIVWNNYFGYMMSQYLTAIVPPPSEQKWFVTIPCESEAQAQAILAIFARAQITT